MGRDTLGMSAVRAINEALDRLGDVKAAGGQLVALNEVYELVLIAREKIERLDARAA